MDCSVTENYFAEKARMTRATKSNLEKTYPEKAVSLVQRWSDEHQPKTYLSEFLINYPNAPLANDGTPMLCPSKLGLKAMDGCIKINRNCDCVKCWNQPIEG